MNLENWLEQKLSDRKEKGNYRELTISKNKIDFVSNDYLGLARSAEIHHGVLKELNTLPAPFNGATGSRLLAGNSELAEETEYFLSRIFESDTTLLFNSGYAANMAVLSCIPQEGDTIFYDELVHACMHDGMRLSKASRVKFNHNDLNDLETKLNASSGKKFIAVESLYSMDGNYCPLQELVRLAERFDAAIILDEAHSTGSFGKNGSGLVIEKGVAEKIPLRIYTFGKAMGAHGACVAGSHTLRNYLINFARPFIYSTAMSPHSLLVIKYAFQFLHDNIHLQKVLQNRVHYFLIQSKKLSYQKIESTSAIQSVMLPGNQEVMALASYLNSVGIDCKGIRSPTVKAGTERLRMCLHTFNTEMEIDKLVETLSNFEKRV